MTIRRWITSAVIVTMVSALAPVNGWAAGTTAASPSPKRLQAAIRQAATKAAEAPSLQLQARPIAAARGRTGVRRQSTGGGHAGMIIGMVSAVVGIGATVYMVKEMEKTTKNLPQ